MPPLTTHPTLGDIGRALAAWAPPGSAQSYDNVGLQVGDPSRTVERALIALDMTPAVLAEARQREATLIVTHHPLLFSPLRTLTSDGFVSNLALRLAEAGIALYSIHTNLDAASGGVSFALADLLGLQDVRFLDAFPDATRKVTALVTERHVDALREALRDNGHVVIYEAPAVIRPGMETPADTHVRLEVEVPQWDVDAVVRTLQTVPSGADLRYDIYPVAQPYTGAGLGAIGRLAASMPLSAFLAHVAERLTAGSLRYVGDPDSPVETVAVCGGSGSSFTRKALRSGADAYVTADVTYHKFFEVLDADGRPRMALIDPGHYETEAFTEGLLQDWLRRRFPTVGWHCTATRTSPIDTFVPPR